ncbi:MAG: glycosyltransferase family 4 protein [Bryobacteraceae bacterium]|jgi:glycosyltransferase involved in cell wall biosynthesis
MRIIVHDFAGHPFQVQLSRELAARGHSVLHLTAEGLPGPKGKLQAAAGDKPGLVIQGVPLSNHFRKYSPVRRLVTQRQYARDLESIIDRERPQVVLSGNTPSDVQAQLLRSCRRHGIGFVHWVQDVYSVALDYVLRLKIGPAARLATLPYRWLDKWVVRNSDGVVAISQGFVPLLRRWGAREETLAVIENWAPLGEVPRLARRNAWSDAQGLNGEPIFLYSGTLGLKHRPDLIYALAREVAGHARVVVVSEGVGRQYLESQPLLPNLTLLDFQSYERLPEMLASADVLLATLEVDAGAFAVPSKVLTYLCAGRPVLLAAPRQNLAAEVVNGSGGGVVVEPNDARAWIEAGQKLADDTESRVSLGLRARQYAEANFDIEKIAGQFEAVLTKAAESLPHLTEGIGPRALYRGNLCP